MNVTLTTNNPQVWNSDLNFTGTGSLNMGNGEITYSADRLVTVNADTLTLEGIINQPAYNFTKAGAGLLDLTNQDISVNNLTISAGTLAATSGTRNNFV